MAEGDKTPVNPLGEQENKAKPGAGMAWGTGIAGLLFVLAASTGSWIVGLIAAAASLFTGAMLDGVIPPLNSAPTPTPTPGTTPSNGQAAAPANGQAAGQSQNRDSGQGVKPADTERVKKAAEDAKNARNTTGDGKGLESTPVQMGIGAVILTPVVGAMANVKRFGIGGALKGAFVYPTGNVGRAAGELITGHPILALQDAGRAVASPINASPANSPLNSTRQLAADMEAFERLRLGNAPLEGDAEAIARLKDGYQKQRIKPKHFPKDLKGNKDNITDILDKVEARIQSNATTATASVSEPPASNAQSPKATPSPQPASNPATAPTQTKPAAPRPEMRTPHDFDAAYPNKAIPLAGEEIPLAPGEPTTPARGTTQQVPTRLTEADLLPNSGKPPIRVTEPDILPDRIKTNSPSAAGKTKTPKLQTLGKVMTGVGVAVTLNQGAREVFDAFDSNDSLDKKFLKAQEAVENTGLDAASNFYTLGLAGGAASTLRKGQQEFLDEFIRLNAHSKTLDESLKNGTLSQAEYDVQKKQLSEQLSLHNLGLKQAEIWKDSAKASTLGVAAHYGDKGGEAIGTWAAGGQSIGADPVNGKLDSFAASAEAMQRSQADIFALLSPESNDPRFANLRKYIQDRGIKVSADQSLTMEEQVKGMDANFHFSLEKEENKRSWTNVESWVNWKKDNQTKRNIAQLQSAQQEWQDWLIMFNANEIQFRQDIQTKYDTNRDDKISNEDFAGASREALAALQSDTRLSKTLKDLGIDLKTVDTVASAATPASAAASQAANRE